jgi:hypothetical protein
MARNRKPAPAARRSEIVEEIVDTLRPWKNRESFASVCAEVEGAIAILQELVVSMSKLPTQNENRDHARRLKAALCSVEELLQTAPSLLAANLFDPLPPEAPIQSIEEIERAYLQRANSFGMELKRLQDVCTRAIKRGIGHHPNYDHAKHLSARLAYALISKASKAKATGTQDGPFRTISALLYEDVSGHRDTDLKRACDDLLQLEKH